jgi:hypothetical protein
VQRNSRNVNYNSKTCDPKKLTNVQNKKYKSFISYSHQDETFAARLHKALETFSIPGNLVGRETEHGVIPRRLSPIFRDREELPSATDLGQEV